MVKVLDFGLAKAMEPPASCRTRAFADDGDARDAGRDDPGHAAYMSPEQARGKAVDKRTDIWAFGSSSSRC